MYDSKTKLSDLVDIVKGEVDIEPAIRDGACARWVSSLEQQLYTDIIGFFRSYDRPIESGGFDISTIPAASGEDEVRFDDIVKLYDDGHEAVRCGTIAAYQFEDEKSIYWQEGQRVNVRFMSGGSLAHIIVRVRPAIKTKDDSSDTVKVPYEWLDMVLAKIRGEEYKLAGDDAQAAKWLGDFNAQLESFKAWVSLRQRWYGE
jgi:hypothetical protein